MKTTFSPFAALLLGLLFIAALALTWFNFSTALPGSLWLQAMRQPNIDAIDQMIFHSACCRAWRLLCWWGRVWAWRIPDG